ncbi:nitronate monooxygenase [Enterococcus faecalis]|uniref:nitronate monooxygenase n=1 Tax=Enterococcus faecalis TaxID=1351 RepID=UPI000E138C44|nr:nitronate monooxygenase [Enterococcus faecalis]RBR96910.1 hypothetical protein EB58_00106 [Enterococcus faecalis]
MKCNRVTKILGIKYPILQGPLSWLTNAELVASVSNAGGMGILGPNAGQTTVTQSPIEKAERYRREIQKTKELTDKPFAASLILNGDMTYTGPILDIVIEEKVSAVLVNIFEGDLDSTIFSRLKKNGVKIIYRPLNPTASNAQSAEKLGADIYVATGFDEGGTVPDKVIGTFSIVPLIVDAVEGIPVVAAGGITDIRGVRASFALGAEGVFVGSVFIPVNESPAAQNVKELIVNSSAEDLLLFRTIPAYYRSLPGELAYNLLEMDNKGVSREEIGKKWGGL